MAETQTIYARVGIDLKSQVDAFAENNGMSLAGAVSELLRRGLDWHAEDNKMISLFEKGLDFLIKQATE